MPLDFTLSPQQEALRDRAREALRPLRGWAARASHGESAEASWRALAGAGLLGAVLPAEHGGSGAGLLALALVLEELGAVGLPSMLPVLTAINAIAIARHGGEDLQRRVLPGVAAGATRLCLGLTEPEAGFNVFRTRTRAERQGESFRLTGGKIYTSGADLADYALVLARSIPYEECIARGLPKTAGLTWLAVPSGSPGLGRTRLPTHGEGTLYQFALDFDNVEVPAGNLVGAEGEGLRVMLDLVNPERVLVSAMLVGTAQHCLDVASEHARNRRVFDDAPIGRYQSIQHPLAEVKIRQEAVRLLAWRAAAAYESGASPKEVSYLGNAAKFLAAELADKALGAAINTLGGRGFDERAGLFHLLEIVALLKVAPISSNLILNQTAEQALGLPRSY